MIQWLIFDFNGTLLNDLPIVYKSIREIFSRYSLTPPTLEQYKQEITADFMKFYRDHGMPEHITGDELNVIRKEVFEKSWNEASLYYDAMPLLENCKKLGLKLAVVSAEIPAVLEKRLEQFGISHHFDHIRGGAWPKKEIAFKEIIEKYNLVSSEAFYADDTFDGIMSAKKCGLGTFGYTGGYNTKEQIISANPDFMIDSLSDIFLIIKKVVIGLTGEKGSGKGTFSEILKTTAKKNVYYMRFSDILSETLKLWHIPATRKNLQKLPVIMNTAYGEGSLTSAVEKRIQAIGGNVVVLDGVRWETDVMLIRKFPRNLLVYITADPKLRYARIKERKEKVGEEGVTLEQFMLEEQALTEVAIPKIGATADIIIHNNYDLKMLETHVQSLAQKFIGL